MDISQSAVYNNKIKIKTEEPLYVLAWHIAEGNINFVKSKIYELSWLSEVETLGDYLQTSF